MKLRAVTKLDRRNKTTSKNFDNDVISGSCDVIVSFWIFGQFGARIPDMECAKVMFSVIVTFFLTKTENKTKNSLTQLSHLL